MTNKQILPLVNPNTHLSKLVGSYRDPIGDTGIPCKFQMHMLSQPIFALHKYIYILHFGDPQKSDRMAYRHSERYEVA